ncbi:MAG: phenylalanine--tRNA ligase subunit beta, partial [Planctomycetes bacterium]|nr:phenylalanine--tRNA ligase subunit beta [Planctomycetota bacterium]
METTLKWLKQYVDFKVGASELDDLFTMSGTECEDMIPVSETGDTAFKFEITSNRTDCYGALGLAREIAAILGVDFVEPKADYTAKGKNINLLTSVALECPDLCPYYSAQLISGVKVQESPKWLQEYIETLSSVKSIRPINNIADITNFVMLEYSQPLHAFDFDKLAENRIVVRRARKDEKIHAIDDREYVLDTEMCVIADAENPQCVGGVMGGMKSEINEETTTVLLEAAYFSPMSIRRTSRKLGLSSDSSYRYERGVDPGAILKASRRAASLIAESWDGAIIHENIIEQGKIVAPSNKIVFRMPAIKKCLGIEVPIADVMRIFKGLGLGVTVSKENEVYDVTAPSFRRDLEREIDLVEEVGRIYGYDKVPTKSDMRIKGVKPNDIEKLTDMLKDIIIGAGFSETFSDSFVPEQKIYEHSPWKHDKSVKANNPIRTGEGLLRKSIIQSLLKIRKFN